MEPRIIANRYHLLDLLGKGAMGMVFRAHDSVLDRAVAIKMMVAGMVDDPRRRERFLKEARAAARLNHRHVVTIHELAEVDGEIYIVMELLDGVDLATLMSGSTALALEAKLSIIDQVLDGLHYAHEQGVVHRDIKPGNLHLTGAGVAKILDFGIARLLSAEMTGTLGVVGTPAYMAPEQALGKEVDRRADLFAVGAVMYELLKGARPFQADSIGRLMGLIAEAPHEPLGPAAPPDVAHLVDRLLAKDPADRPQTAEEARAELAAVHRGLDEASTYDPAAELSALVRGIVTARETIAPDYGRPRSPRPPTPLDGAPASSATSGLTTFALQQGRTLREQGDLGGAMRALRSVLAADPGNAEALSELQLVEQALSGSTAPAQSAPPGGRRWLAPASVAAIGLLALAIWFASDRPGQEPVEPPAAPATPAPVGPAGEDGTAARRRGTPFPGGSRSGRGGGAERFGATALVRQRFEQLSRAVDEQELDESVRDELTSIRSAADALNAAGNTDEAGEIYFRGVLLLEDVLPPPPAEDPARADRSDRTPLAGMREIRRTIDEYVSGLERRDPAAVREVRPVLSEFEQRLLAADTPARVRFDDLQARPVLTGATGATGARIFTARVVVEWTEEPPRRQEYRMWMALMRDGDRWQIRDMRSFTNRRPASR